MKGNWIVPAGVCNEDGGVVFCREWTILSGIQKAELMVSALGIYEARINGVRVSDTVFAPGWTQYERRLQYQTYDVKALLQEKNRIEIEVGTGWMRGRIAHIQEGQRKLPPGVIAVLSVQYSSGETVVLESDDQWQIQTSPILFSDIYDGETVDARIQSEICCGCKVFDFDKTRLIPQEGEVIKEQERLTPTLLITPKGEKVLDFGQNMTGVMECRLEAKAGERLVLECGEVLDAEGNFYNENYRSSQSRFTYICNEGVNLAKPKFSFFGFRYLCVKEHPDGELRPENFTGIVIHSELKRTGWINSGNEKLNRFFENVFWGQKGNYLDVPTDCPQRDERMGWTGDAQVFARAASLNFDVERFFRKWLRDMRAAAAENGAIPMMVPYYFKGADEKYVQYYYNNGAAWGDAATICPWEMYLTYGNAEALREQFPMMKGYVDYMTQATQDALMFTGHHQFGDWLGIDAPAGSYKGVSRDDLIAQAFYARSAGLVVKAGKVLGYDVAAYEALYTKIVEKFQTVWGDAYKTQTEHALALYFGLAKDREKTARTLAGIIEENGYKLTTGFVGTPYLLYALSENGYGKMAYRLLLQDAYPSWLFSVDMGATTVWEHWDGKKADGSLWSKDMNSFNHYAYGAVIDWVYTVAAGIQRLEDAPGFSKVRFAPLPEEQLQRLEVVLHTRQGKLQSKWTYEKEFVRYEFETPVEAEIVIDGQVYLVKAGRYMFLGKK